VRLFFGILLAFVIIGLGGAITGVVNGVAINRIDTGGERRRYLIGAGYAYGVGQGMLIIPVLLLISLIGIYNNGTQDQPQGYILLFGLLGLTREPLMSNTWMRSSTRAVSRIRSRISPSLRI